MNELTPNWDVSAETMGELMEENTQLKAKLEKIRQRIEKAWFDNDSESTEYLAGDWFSVLNDLADIVDEEPQQSLAHIQAEAVERFKNELVNSVHVAFKPHIEGVCAVVQQELRQQANKG